jgi:hypothetical protein
MAPARYPPRPALFSEETSMTTERDALVERAAQLQDLDEADRALALRDFAAMVDDIAERYGQPFALAAVGAMVDAAQEDPDRFFSVPDGEAYAFFTARIPPAVWAEGQRQRAAREGRIQA